MLLWHANGELAIFFNNLQCGLCSSSGVWSGMRLLLWQMKYMRMGQSHSLSSESVTALYLVCIFLTYLCPLECNLLLFLMVHR